jgi:hypothetical protein
MIILGYNFKRGIVARFILVDLFITGSDSNNDFKN